MTSPGITLLPQRLAAPSADTLALIHYGLRPAPADTREIVVPLPPLGEPHSELWSAAGPVRRGRDGAIGWAEDGAHLFFRLAADCADSADMEGAADRAYHALLDLLAARGYPHPLRIWNYFDEVTRGEGDDERYRRFCVGRHRALAASSADFERRLPAATVIGSAAPGFVLYGFAARQPGEQIENPRQTSAFRYPREYGARSPSFSRAKRAGSRLYVSGTAAVVGHATRHAHDTPGQTAEMLANLDALLRQAGGGWQAALLRLYLRDPADAAAAQAAVRAAYPQAPLQLLQGEVCRRDLMVEIEGVFERR